jgi:hypothetical protein
MDRSDSGPKKPTDAAEELRKEAAKVQEKLKELLREISELIEKSRKLSKELGDRWRPSSERP